ncbi:hypothetical protein [Methylorubrum sp. SB2]|uniref:hypothetical protein n=1 Tax=Methylorubrum subtropicum TaxID=3138812 RepID=UPI00313BF6F4
MNTVRGIGEWAVPIALFYGIRAAMGARAFEDWFGPYIKLGHLVWDRLPDWNHPIVLVVGAAFVLLLLSGWLRLARGLASAVAALFVVRSAFAVAGEGSVPPPDLWLGAAAVLALGWLLFSVSFGDPRFRAWLKHR